MLSSKTVERVFWIDNLRAIACFFVILLHVSGPWFYNIKNFNSIDFIGITFIHSITRFCVPVFLMISGCLLLEKKYLSYSSFITHHVFKIIKPFLFWSLLYTLLFLIYNIYQGAVYNFNELTLFFTNSFLSGAAYHLWYIYLILALYLIIPLIAKIIRYIANIYVVLFLLFWLVVLFLAQYYPHNEALNYIRLTVGYFGFLILGYFLKNLQLKKKSIFFYSLILILIGLVGTIYLVLSTAMNYNFIDYSIFYYLNINVVMLSAGFFLLIKSINIEIKPLSLVAKHSFGIYFIHLFYIMLINKLWIYQETFPLLLYIILVAFLCLLLSYYSIFFLKKITFLTNLIS